MLEIIERLQRNNESPVIVEGHTAKFLLLRLVIDGEDIGKLFIYSIRNGWKILSDGGFPRVCRQYELLTA